MSYFAGGQVRDHLNVMILATLDQGKAHGSAMIQRLEVADCGSLRLSEGALYPALYRLESGDW